MSSYLTYEGFAQAAAEFFPQMDSVPAPTARLIEDLQLDSLDLYELVLVVEDAAGYAIPEGMIESFETFGDVYDCYAAFRSGAIGPDRIEG